MEPEREREGNFTMHKKIHGEGKMWSTAQRQKKIYGLDVHLRLSETIDQCAMANSVCWHGHVLRREDGHIIRKALNFEVKGHRKKTKLKMTWKKQAEEESVKVDLRMEDALC